MTEIFDWEEDDVFDAAWDFPRLDLFGPNPTGWWSTMTAPGEHGSESDNYLYEACPLCDLGTASFSPGMLVMECPACAGSGLGKRHAC